MIGPFRLFQSRRFRIAYLLQWLSAFQVTLLAAAWLALQFHGQIPEPGKPVPIALTIVAVACIVLPLLALFGSFGAWTDGETPRRLWIRIKWIELGVGALSGVALYSVNEFLMLAALAANGTISAASVPLRYAQLRPDETTAHLPAANGLVSAGLAISVALGAAIGAAILLDNVEPISLSALFVVLPALGLLLAQGLEKSPAGRAPVDAVASPLRAARVATARLAAAPVVLRSALGIAWFWFMACLLLTQLPVYASDAHPVVTAVLGGLLCGGFVTGALAVDWLSDHRIEMGIVPIGAIGMTLFGIDLAFAVPEAGELAMHSAIALLLLGFSGALFVVPLHALAQARTSREQLGQVMAAQTAMSALFLMVALGYAQLAAWLAIEPVVAFAVAAFANAAIAAYIFILEPLFLVQFMVWFVLHLMYRVSKRGMDHIPESGPCVLVCNHVSFLDPVVLGGCAPRLPRFVMYHKIFNVPVLKFFFQTVRAIPIAPAKEDEQMLARAYESIAEALDNGELVIIFPEGGITWDGEIQPFKPGIERILERNPVPVVPMALRGLWGSFFSREGGAAMSRPFRRFWSRVELVVGEPIPPEQVTAPLLETRVRELRGDLR